MAKIELINMTFYAHHGCFEKERRRGSRFSVDLCVEPESCRACFTDRVEDTADYAVLYSLVQKEMSQNSRLLEHVGARIIGAVRERFPSLKHIDLKISKFSPSVGGKLTCSRICLTESDLCR